MSGSSESEDNVGDFTEETSQTNSTSSLEDLQSKCLLCAAEIDGSIKGSFKEYNSSAAHAVNILSIYR